MFYQIKSFKYLLENLTICPIHIHFKCFTLTKIFSFFSKENWEKVKMHFWCNQHYATSSVQLNWNIPLIFNLLITFIETHTRTMLQHAKNFLQHAQTLTNIHYTFF